MSRNVTSILTMAAMLLHSILGCCAHHAHACEQVESAVRCQTEHNGLHAEVSEVAHDEHRRAAHKDCHSAPRETVTHCRGMDHQVQEPNLVGDDEVHEPLPHSPCQQSCDDGDCRFTQSSVVRTPSPGEGQLICPVFVAADTGLPGRTQASFRRADSGPPDALRENAVA